MAFSNPIIGGNDTLVRDAIQSEGFQTGVAGWRIERNGDAEFNDVIVRGELEARNGDAFIRLDPAEPELAFNPDDTNYLNGTLNFIDLAGAGVETSLTGGRDAGQGVPSLVLTSNALPNGTAKMQASRFEVSGDLVFLNDTIGARQYAEKGSAQTSTTTVLADVTDLSFPVSANAKYEIALRVAYDGPTGTDMALAWTVPASSVMDRCILAPQLGTADNQNTAVTSIRRSAGTAQQGGTPNGVANAFSVWWEDCILTTAGTSGTAQVQFARVGGAGTLTLQSRSWISVTRIA